MSISDEKAPRVPRPLEKQLRAASDEVGQWTPYFAGAFAVWPLMQFGLVPALELSATAGEWLALSVAVLAGFVAQAIFTGFLNPPEPPVPPDRDEAV